MPLFEYRCQSCDKRFTFLSGVVSGEVEPQCPVCASKALKKLISRFRAGRSDDERMESIAEKLESRDLDNASDLRRFAREMGKEIGAETGEDLGDEMEELIENESQTGPSGSGDDAIY